MVDRKEKKEGDVTYSFSSDWITRFESEEHWLLYRQQQFMIHKVAKEGDNFLEIGPGTGFCSGYLRGKGFNVTTIDIDEAKKPDIVANITTYVPEKRYDHIIAFEILEHIPYEECLKSLKTLSSYCKYFTISVPYNEERLIRARLSLPIIKHTSFSITLPKSKISEPNHFWEVNHGKQSEKKVISDFLAQGYTLKGRSKFVSRLYITLESKHFNS